jgi:simple sugar transport system ATP-binding protein
VVIVSSELDEIYALADRIAVIYEGKITGFRDPDVPTAELGRLMAGGADSTGVPGAFVDAAGVLRVDDSADAVHRPDADAGLQPDSAGDGHQPGDADAGPAAPPAAQEES